MTSTEIDIRQQATLAIRPGQEFWTDKQRAALGVLGIRNATNADLAVFMHYCQRTQLDPFSRQIYMICRREKQGDQWVDKQTIQVGIGGFQVIRDRIATRLGITVEYEDTIWYDADGGEHSVWLRDDPPAAAKVVVLKNGKRFPGVCRTAAYMQRNKEGQPAGQWRTQPDHMIEKCAEAFALRRAFPHDLGGLYIEEELPQAPVTVQAKAQRVQPAPVTAADITDPGPAVPPAGGPDQTAGPEPGRNAGAGESNPPGPATPKPRTRPLGELYKLLSLDEGEQKDIIAWLVPDWTGSRTDIRIVATTLESYLEHAADVEEARSQLWTDWRRVTGQDDAADGQGSGDGH